MSKGLAKCKYNFKKYKFDYIFNEILPIMYSPQSDFLNLISFSKKPIYVNACIHISMNH